jgi:hypothetical protein
LDEEIPINDEENGNSKDTNIDEESHLDSVNKKSLQSKDDEDKKEEEDEDNANAEVDEEDD